MAKIYKIALIFLFLNVLPTTVQAASLYFSPSSGSYTVGNTLSVNVYVSSADQAMNAASGVISFPQDKLEVTSLSKSGSIFSLWVQEPLFSNSAGTVNFEGIVLNPGFTGSNGKAITITFRTKAAGNAPLTFSSGSVLANDGKGTNILANLGNAQFSLGGAGPIPSAVSGTPSAPQISSPTHPDPNKWYAKKDAKFMWSVPSDAIAIRLLYDKYPNSQPKVIYEPAITEKEITDLKDGIYYFHIQFKNNKGWGAISHFRFQIDIEPPEPFEIKFVDPVRNNISNGVDAKETTNPQPTVLFDTTDSLSGIEYYKVKIGEGNFFTVAPEIVKSNPYTLPLQNPGKRTILVQAFDKADNYTTAVEEFEILSIKSPSIIEYPKELQSKEPLIVRGSTYANSKVSIWLQKEKDDPKSFTVESDQDGKFTFISEERLRDGIYNLWAEVVDNRGARSLATEKITIVIARPAIFRIGTWAISFLAIIIPFIALIILLLFIIWYGWYKFSLLRRRLKKEITEAEKALYLAFKELRKETKEQIEKLDGKPGLNEREKKICNDLKKSLKISEKFINKEIKDIEKKLH